MKSLMSLSTLLLFVAALFAFTPAVDAQCVKTIKSRSGTVYAGGPAKTTFTPGANEITLEITKQGGRAQTIVNVYINNQMRGSATMVFNNGNYTRTMSKKITNVRGKSVRVEIVNQSVGNKFEYRLRAKEETDKIGSGQGNIFGQDKKTFTLGVACDSNGRITIRRTGGNAKALITIRSLSGRILNGSGTVMQNNENSKVISVSGIRNQRIRVEVKNISVGNWFKFNMSAKTY